MGRILTLERRWVAQPPVGVKLNASDPLLRGLIWAFDYGGQSLGGEEAPAVTYRSGYATFHGGFGKAVVSDVASAGFTFTSPLDSLDEFTLVTLVYQQTPSGPATTDSLSGIGFGGGATTGTQMYGFGAGQALYPNVYAYPDFTGTNGFECFSALPTRGFYTLVQVFRRNSLHKLFVNELVFAAGSAPGDWPASFNIGGTGGEWRVNGVGSQSAAVMATWLQRVALTDVEAQQVTRNPWGLFRPLRLWIPGWGASGVTPLEADATDSVTLSDSAVSVTERLATAADTLTPSDSAVSVTERSATATDSVLLSDSAIGVPEFPAVATDSVSLSDSAVSVSERVSAASDSLSLGDAAVSITERLSVAEDALSLNDSSVSFSERLATASDSVSLTDASEGFVAVPAEATDSVSLSDGAVSVSERGAVADDSVSLSDAAVSATERLSVADDTLSLSDSGVSTTERLSVAEDALSLTDSAEGEAVAGAVATGSDTLTLSDSAVGVTERVAAAGDTLSLSDSAEADRAAIATASDALSLSDSAEGALLRDGEATDTITLGDSATAVVVPPTPTGGGGRAWLRAWLQQQYTKDFEEYERRRAERKAPAPPPAAAKRSPATPATPSKTLATPAQRPVEATELAGLVMKFQAAVKSPPPLQLELPPLSSLDDVKAAVAKRPAPEFTAEDEELVLQIARTLNL